MKAFKNEGVDEIELQEEFTRMVRQYQNLVFSVCVKLTNDYFAAEDLTQDTFLSAYIHLKSFDGAQEKAWLCRIASNKCMDYLRQAAKKPVLDQEHVLEDKETESGLPEKHFMEGEVRRELKERCRELKPPYDEIAHLYFYEERKPEEIAAIKEKNIKTIQTQIYRARAMLRKLYGKERG